MQGSQQPWADKSRYKKTHYFRLRWMRLLVPSCLRNRKPCPGALVVAIFDVRCGIAARALLRLADLVGKFLDRCAKRWFSVRLPEGVRGAKPPERADFFPASTAFLYSSTKGGAIQVDSPLRLARLVGGKPNHVALMYLLEHRFQKKVVDLIILLFSTKRSDPRAQASLA